MVVVVAFVVVNVLVSVIIVVVIVVVVTNEDDGDLFCRCRRRRYQLLSPSKLPSFLINIRFTNVDISAPRHRSSGRNFLLSFRLFRFVDASENPFHS